MSSLVASLHARIALALALVLLVATSAHATVVVELSVEELVAQADAIVHARVARTGSRLETYRDQLEPHTMSELAVVDWLKGSGGARVLVDEIGGASPSGERWIAGTPRYAVGDEVVVFLRRLPTGSYRTLGLAQGRFEVRYAVGPDLVGRRVVARDTGDLSYARVADGATTITEGGPSAEVDYDRFVALVRSVLDEGEVVSTGERLR